MKRFLALLAVFSGLACTGPEGPQGDSCTVVDNGDGTSTITCGSTSITVADGADGAIGTNGTNGEPCTGVNNGDGTFTITCPGGTPFVVTDPSFVPAAYAAADGMVGGVAYAKWWVTQASGAGTLAGAGVTVGAEWVRCKTCHAWDGMGNQASYANRTGQSTGAAARPDVSSIDLWMTTLYSTPQELFDLIKGVGGRPLNTQGNGHPDFSAAMTDAQIWNLVKFMREQWIYPDELYRLAVDGPPVYTNSVGAVVAPALTYYGIGKDGNATNGDAIYTASCAGCHGATGTAMMPAGFSVGELARTKPNEVWHKAKFGNIGDSSAASMAPGILVNTADILDLYLALTSTTAYPDAP